MNGDEKLSDAPATAVLMFAATKPKGSIKSVAVLPEVLPGITGLVAHVGNVPPPLLFVAQLAAAPYSVLPLANVSTCRIAPMFVPASEMVGEVATGPTPDAYEKINSGLA